VEDLERIAGRLAHAVSASEQTPEEMQESASLVAELATEFEAFQKRTQTKDPEPVPSAETTSTIA
jgi:hypothetical protein